MGKKTEKVKDEKGITAEKEDDFTDWFTQLMIKAELADYTDVSGCIVFRPASYAIWEKIKEECDIRFKKLGVKNAYFPLFIPEHVLVKEQEHIEGFSPEVAWVTHAGDTKLSERLAVRPTSETIMYESYSKWIRSWRDLPLKLNQWNNVVRWEFKHPVPFLRTREFLWNEGHTVYATKKEAESEKDQIIGIYKEVCEEFLALPSLIGKKSDKEKFAGAEYTISMEFYMPNGKCIQGPDFHHDGQNFAKAYNIKFLNKVGKEEYAYQNTWAITTRMLGVTFAIHSDKKGLILPPRIAVNKVVIVPIFFGDSKEKVLKKAKEVGNSLSELGAIVDEREEYSAGYKFNDWELKGIPLRIEIGPKDLEKDSVVLVRRDNGEKESVKIKDVKKKVEGLLEDIQTSLFKRADKLLRENILRVSSASELKKAIAGKKIAFAPLCRKRGCEDMIKFESVGGKVLNIPEEQPKELGKSKCVICGDKAEYFGYVGKSY
ncbi:MAG: proline--tRNA ligase [Nanoarchaeota archaeon]|nr:proline--tRNA ligase [Nanoarchaeota archaeon]